VYCIASEASQSKKLGSADEAVSLQAAVGKTKLLYIGMNTDKSSKFQMKCSLRKSFPIDKTSSNILPPSTEVRHLIQCKPPIIFLS